MSFSDKQHWKTVHFLCFVNCTLFELNFKELKLN